MSSIALAIIAVAVVALFLFLVTRKPTSRAELPREAPTPAAAARREAPPVDDAAAAPAAPRIAEPRSAAGPAAAAPATAVVALARGAPPETKATPTAQPAPDDAARRRDLDALKQGLATTRDGFISRLARLFVRHKDIDAGLFEEIEEVLLTADVGVQTSHRIIEHLRARMKEGALTDEASVWKCLREQAAEILERPAMPIALTHKPSLILVIGVNGVGKTTTIGKLASRYAAEGKKVLLAAGDTYRAAAVLQLEVWGRRVSCPVVKGKDNADPGSVIFEAVRKARDEGFDLVIADTAGRLHTKAPLMDELKKVERTCSKALDGRAPDEILLVLDSTTGQNAVQQTHMFREALNVSGIVLTKLDGTAKGGVILGIVHQHGIPVRFVGLGERVEDLREFDAKDFAEALFAKSDVEPSAA